MIFFPLKQKQWRIRSQPKTHPMKFKICTAQGCYWPKMLFPEDEWRPAKGVLGHARPPPPRNIFNLEINLVQPGAKKTHPFWQECCLFHKTNVSFPWNGTSLFSEISEITEKRRQQTDQILRQQNLLQTRQAHRGREGQPYGRRQRWSKKQAKTVIPITKTPTFVTTVVLAPMAVSPVLLGAWAAGCRLGASDLVGRLAAGVVIAVRPLAGRHPDLL